MNAAIEESPSPLRISAMSLAMFLNIAFLVALSLMQVEPPAMPRLDEPVPIQIVDLIFTPPKPLMPPPPMPQAPVRPVEKPTPQPIAKPIQMPVESNFPIETELAPAPEIFAPSDAIPTPVAPVGEATGTAALQLAILKAPRPPYPPREMRLRHEGEVTLRLRIGADGRPVSVEVDRSSGYPALDQSAARHVLNTWRFAPPGGNGEVMGLLPVRFSLQ